MEQKVSDLFLAVDRLIGDVCEFLGVSKDQLITVGQWTELQDKLTALDAAIAALQNKCYDIDGIK